MAQKNEEYITPDMWDLYNVKQDTNNATTPSAPTTLPVFHTTYVGRSRSHYPKENLEYRKYNNYNPSTGKRCTTCTVDCTHGVPTKQFGTTQKMSYSQGILKHPECINGPSSTGRCEIVPNTITQVQYKYNVLQHNSNYTGTSKKMAYGKYVRATPGFETFASKKIPVIHIADKEQCWTDYICKHI
jgi:hypothetical protein